MERIEFVAVADMDMEEYPVFATLSNFEKEHPLRRLYEYIMYYYGGVRKDVLLFLSDEGSILRLSGIIEDSTEPGLKNEWYRRLVRLLQCNAEAEWYRLYLMDTDKSRGYIQYFLNQVATYAEMGKPVNEVRRLFLECDAGCFLEYEVSLIGKKEYDTIHEPQPGEKDTANEMEPEKLDVPAPSSEKKEWEEILAPVLDGQRELQKMLQLVLNTKTEVSHENVGFEVVEMEEQCFEVGNSNLSEVEEPEEESVESMEKIELQRNSNVSFNREHAVSFANLFQRIRVKRNSNRLRKLDRMQQLQEVVVAMSDKNFTTKEMGIVRKLIDKDVSLAFLYPVIQENDAVEKLGKMLDYLEYQEKVPVEE